MDCRSLFSGLVLLLPCLCFRTPAVRAGEGRHPITHEDVWLMRGVGAPVPSPDGRWVVVPVTEPAYDEKDEVADLWLVPGDGGTPPRRFTTARSRESAPAWSPDGTRLAFVAKREGDDYAQVYVMDREGGEARRVTRLALGARLPMWSPDGRLLAVQAPVYRAATNDASNLALAEERKKAKSKVRVFEGFPIRRWDAWLDEVQTRLLVVSPDGTGPSRDVLVGSRVAAAPGFRGVSDEGATDTLQPCWAPDSKSLVFVATTNLDVAAWATPVFHLFEVGVEGGEPRRLTDASFQAGHPKFTPDGTRLLFTTNAGVGEVYHAIDRLVAARWPWEGEFGQVAAGYDRSVGTFAVTPDSRRVWWTAEDEGQVRIWSAPVEGGGVRLELGAGSEGGVWSGLRLPERAASPVLFASREAAHRPAEVVRVDLDGKRVTVLTDFNRERTESIDWAPLREFWFTNAAGRRVHSFLALPPGFEESKRYPLLVLMHGGHASMWRNSFGRRWNYHLLARPGYVVLLTDYVGSTGYGEAFTRAIQRDPLRGPAEDLNAAADEAIRRYPFIDGARQAAAGASYGGHLANWMEATTTRYRCLISHAGLASLYGQWSTSDAIRHRELMMGGPFWERPEAWLDQSPARYASAFRTPMLLSVGEGDFRVPLNNALEMWSLLQRQRVPSRFLVWPDENHWIQKGENSRVFYREVHAWLERWLR
jgi:dipeptidyl aminopeptidase/acylaminoacyl peptidase